MLTDEDVAGETELYQLELKNTTGHPRSADTDNDPNGGNANKGVANIGDNMRSLQLKRKRSDERRARRARIAGRAPQNLLFASDNAAEEEDDDDDNNVSDGNETEEEKEAHESDAVHAKHTKETTARRAGVVRDDVDEVEYEQVGDPKRPKLAE